MKDLELKVENSPEIIFRSNEIVIRDGSVDSVEYPASTGIMFGEGRYGFIIVIETKTEKLKRTYPTQCSIAGIQEIDGTLNIWEQHKYPSSWKFNKDGEYINHAVFSGIWLPELEFLFQQKIIKVPPHRGPNYRLPDYDKKSIEAINTMAYLGEPETVKLEKAQTKSLLP